MPPFFQEHPLRHTVTAALHARTVESLHAPERVSYLAVVCGEQGSDRQGLSVIAIGYYGVALIGYALKGLEHGGAPVDATLGIGIAVP